MSTKPDPPSTDGFEETAEIPPGRKARIVPDELWVRLARSAAANVGFTKTAAPDVIDELRKDLSAAAVRAKYEVTVQTVKVNDTAHKLTFSARVKEIPVSADTETPVTANA